jgi:hypothetical protein
MAPRVAQHPGTRPTEHGGSAVDTNILRNTAEKVPAPTATEEAPHGCWQGYVYLGFEAEDESGEHVELVERVACRRCSPEDL